MLEHIFSSASVKPTVGLLAQFERILTLLRRKDAVGLVLPKDPNPVFQADRCEELDSVQAGEKKKVNHWNCITTFKPVHTKAYRQSGLKRESGFWCETELKGFLLTSLHSLRLMISIDGQRLKHDPSMCVGTIGNVQSTPCLEFLSESCSLNITFVKTSLEKMHRLRFFASMWGN